MMRRPHRIPLAPRAMKVLGELRAVTGNGRFLFPSNRSHQRCMSENTINAALRRLGFTKEEMTAHGFRSAASSMLNECGLWNADAIGALKIRPMPTPSSTAWSSSRVGLQQNAVGPFLLLWQKLWRVKGSWR
jgi:hypothetical protein